MTDLMYRGIAHTGTKATTSRSAQALLYRGIAHDGLAETASQPARTARMCYRGVHYVALREALAPPGSPDAGISGAVAA